jgi:hypothetical protein
LGATDNTGRQRIAFHITADTHEASRLFDQVRFESPLVDVPFPDRFPMPVKTHRVGSRYPVQQS